MATISATIVDGLDALDAELAGIDENLNRNQLSAAVHAILLGRRKRLYVARHPETSVGAAQRAMLARRRGERDDTRVDCFVDDLARVSGMSACHVRNIIRPAEFLGEQRLRRLIGTSMDSQIQLLYLCRLPAKDRDALIERAANGEAVSARIIWQDKKKRRGKAPLRARPSPPLDEPEPTPVPPDANEIIEVWKRATSFERRAFVRSVRTELTAIIRILDAAARVPAPSFCVVARAAQR